MQEIKFKVWDGRKICGVKNIEFAEDGIIVTKDDGYFGYLGSDFELLQYTGLKDKNGKEIYRGHIFDCSYVNPLTGEKVLKLYEVVFRNGSFMAKHKDSPYGDTLLHFINKTGCVTEIMKIRGEPHVRRKRGPVRLNDHAYERWKLRVGPASRNSVADRIRRRIAAELKNGAEVNRNGALEIEVVPGVRAICYPSLTGGWEIATVIKAEPLRRRENNYYAMRETYAF